MARKESVLITTYIIELSSHSKVTVLLKCAIVAKDIFGAFRKTK